MKYWRILLVYLWVIPTLAMAAVSLELSSPSVSMGETVELKLMAKDSQTATMPDLTPLHTDFTITGTARNTSVTIINGKARSVSEWTILMTPKHPGMITIPPILIGNESTTATVLEVTGKPLTSPRNQASPTQGKGLWIETSLSTNNPYVNQQVLLTVRLYANRQLLEAQYAPPMMDDGLVVTLGKSRSYSKDVNGETVGVEEQQYAVFAQKSGTLKIKPPVLNALVLDAVPERVSVTSRPMTLDVKPIAPAFQGKHWLIAQSLRLEETYDSPARAFSAGNALVRTVSMRAEGVPAQLLPVPKPDTVAGVSAYAETPQTRNTVSQNALTGTLSVKVTYVFESPGKVTLPAIRIPWYNSRTGEQEEAVLPPLTLEVTALPTAAKPASPTPLVHKPEAAESPSTPQSLPPGGRWRLTFVIIMAGWMLTLLLWWWQSRAGQSCQRRKALKALKKTCKRNEPQAASQALVAWARLQWPEGRFLNVMDVATRAGDADLTSAIDDLAKACYDTDKASSWQGALLWECIRKADRVDRKS